MLPAKMKVLGVAFLNAGIFLIAVRSITRGVFAKNHPEWRLAAVTDSQAASLKAIVDFGALVIAINILLKEMTAVAQDGLMVIPRNELDLLESSLKGNVDELAKNIQKLHLGVTVTDTMQQVGAVGTMDGTAI